MPERYACAPRYNIARGQTAPAIVGGAVRTLRWGLLAPWRGHGGKRGPMIYEAPEDAIATTPLLRNAKRCLIPADGFYAWRKIGSKRVPYYIHGATRVHFAGLATTHADDGIESFAIIVVPASPLVAAIAPTMPRATEPLDGWRADAVSSWVNDLAHDDAQCIAPLGNPAQGELF
jgi:putative SOS response-associated peptidase YedK